MSYLETERLRLIPLSHKLLLLWQQDRAAMELQLGLNPSAMVIDAEYQFEMTDALVNFWLPKTAEFPDKYEWYTNWEIVFKAENKSIGGIGVGYPNEDGVSETGFMLDASYQGRGLALEALKAMLGWAFRNGELKTILARTYTHNEACRKLVQNAGFVQVKEEEGLLHYHKCRRPLVLST
ncbi:GNAT family N-acetyltransferase [Chitinophaga horti]|uniref:GNAT family N-acetyltransferase n=1 Tax=Chitinophaga horti TaxID=2920382 RepID=A0ABY6IZ55_9BACT|nr:GNAT family N-acetyltransferase [Chitinophaga horti]UYQ92655.1 GNAT family N-acetyltransferase [Chitinophaga horti]